MVDSYCFQFYTKENLFSFNIFKLNKKKKKKKTRTCDGNLYKDR